MKETQNKMKSGGLHPAGSKPGPSAPLILISPSTQRRGAEFFDYSMTLSDAYPRAIAAAGGIPWILSCTPSLDLIAESVRRADGVLLTGGDDVRPEIYGVDPSPKLRKTIVPADPERDLAELLLVQEVFRQRKPLLAICRGQQILNVALGGSLIVDIPTQRPDAINHSRTDLKDRVVHEIDIQPGSLIHQVFELTRLGVNSTHHQAVDRLAKPFCVTATGPDGIAEAIELSASDRELVPFLLAVQFHPERLIDRHPHFLKLFQSFILAAGKTSL